MVGRPDRRERYAPLRLPKLDAELGQSRLEVAGYLSLVLRRQLGEALLEPDANDLRQRDASGCSAGFPTLELVLRAADLQGRPGHKENDGDIGGQYDLGRDFVPTVPPRPGRGQGSGQKATSSRASRTKSNPHQQRRCAHLIPSVRLRPGRGHRRSPQRPLRPFGPPTGAKEGRRDEVVLTGGKPVDAGVGPCLASLGAAPDARSRRVRAAPAVLPLRCPVLG
jgi:hypothetical protein